MRGIIATVCGVFGAGVLIAGPAAPTGYEITSVALASHAQQQQQPPPPPPPAQQQEVLLNTVGKVTTGPKLGMQTFAGPAETARVVAEVLWNDLDYEREYQMISRKATAGIPAATSPALLPFDTWKEAGADYVMMGTVQDNGGKLAVEIRVVRVGGVEPGAIKFAQRYDGCASANLRYCAHHIADDVHKKEMNLDGVARTRIAFTSDRAGERLPGRPTQDSTVGKEIYLMDYDGARQTRVTSSRSLNIAPTWGPDGRTLAYASFASGYPDVYVSTLDGRPVQRPARGTERIHNWDPEISPDGTMIAFTSSRVTQGQPDIWVMNRDGSNLRNLTPTSSSAEGAPTWSPGGNQIAFTSDRTGLNQLYVMNADGTGVRRLTFDKQVDRPTWSVRGFIAYTLRQPSGHDIARLDLARTEPRVITDGRGSNVQPTVSPNGRHIIFVTTRWGKQHLASVDLDGKNIRQLTEVGNNTHPSWSPSPGR